MDLDKLKGEDRKPVCVLCSYLRTAGLDVELEGAAEQGKEYSEIELKALGSVESVARAVSGLYGYGSTVSAFGAVCDDYSITEGRAAEDLSRMHLRVRLGDVRTMLRMEVRPPGQHSYDELLRSFLVERSYTQVPVGWRQLEIPGFEAPRPSPLRWMQDLESFCGCTRPAIGGRLV